jgi:hypothetical protein
MTDLSKYINTSIGVENEEWLKKNGLMLNTPDFHWVVRDFFLASDKTSDEYLEDCLKLEAEGQDGREIEEVNSIRKSIKSSFASRNCTCLPSPIESGTDGRSFEESLQFLDQIEWHRLRVNFREGIEGLCKQIKENIAPKSLFSVPLSAFEYAQYLKLVVEQLNRNELVSLGDALAESLKSSAEKSLQDAIDLYENSMDAHFKAHPMPNSWQILEK